MGNEIYIWKKPFPNSKLETNKMVSVWGDEESGWDRMGIEISLNILSYMISALEPHKHILHILIISKSYKKSKVEYK